MDKFHAKNRRSPYAARLYARSKPLNTKNAFSAAQHRSKRTADKTANNVTNATAAATVSVVAKTSIRNRFGKPTHQANKPPPNLPPPTAAAAKPSCAISKKPRRRCSLPLPPALTSSWTPPISAAVSASWFYSTASVAKPCPLPKSKPSAAT